MKKIILHFMVLALASTAYADNWVTVKELVGATVTLESDILLDRVIEMDPSDELGSFVANSEVAFIFQGKLMSKSDFEAVHSKEPYCTISVFQMDTEEAVILTAGSVTTQISDAISVKGKNFKNGRYNWISVQSDSRNLAEGQAYISSVSCNKPEGFWSKKQITWQEMLDLTKGVLTWNLPK